MRRLFVIGMLLMTAQAAAAAEVARAGAHVFHSSFWMSLHERLRHEALVPETRDVADAEWTAATAAYRQQLGRRSAVFDEELVRWTRAIARSGDGALTKDVPEPLAAALHRAAPFYRAHDWPRDDAANRFWIAYAAELVRQAGGDISARLAQAYGAPLPKALHVEVAPYADPFGANTPEAAGDLYLTTVASRVPGIQGFSALELLFHEPLHHLDTLFDGMLAAAAKRANVPVPGNLSHAILFYTVGDATRRALAARGTSYTPYAYATGVHKRAWPELLPLLEEHWQAYLDGKLTRDDALAKILTAAPRQ
ncbi:MAG TPA: hypothetical protein VF824_19305 [Thermoanaerobaculia bacterium]|jgi:hypothetical protein